MPEAPHLYATDYRWWKHHIGDIVRGFDGKLWTQSRDWLEDPAQWSITALRPDEDGTDLLQSPGLSRDPEVIHTGSNSTYAAVNLAYHLGAERILLLGLDLGRGENDQRHFFGDHPAPFNADSDYHQFINKFMTIDPAQYGLEIWNVSRRTAMAHFPIYDFDEIMERL